MASAALSRSSTVAVRNVRRASLPAFAAAISLSSGIAHFGVMAPHLQEWWLHGLFFLVCGTAQVLFAVLIVSRPGDRLALAGIAGNLAVVITYVYSRTNGPPLGPHRGVPEQAGVYDMATTAGEIALIVLLVAMLGPRARRVATRAVLLVGVALWTARAAGVLL